MSLRESAREVGVGKSTVERWVERARSQRLDRIDLSDQKPGRAWNRMAPPVEQRIAELRVQLRKSVLGEDSARAIYCALEGEMDCPPSQAAINRALARLGLQDAVRRTRRPAPPKGWYLPDVAAGRAELDCFDFIEDLKIADGPLVSLLTAKSLHASLTDAWVTQRSTDAILPCLLARWQRDGLPRYAQFDNDTVFQGLTSMRTRSVVSAACACNWASHRCSPAARTRHSESRASMPCGRRRSGSALKWPMRASCSRVRIATSRRIAGVLARLQKPRHCAE